MKKQILAIALLFSSSYSFSQTEKGGTLVGGSFSLQTTKGNSRFSLDPNVGYFFAKNLALGATVKVDFSKLGETRTNQLGIGPYVRYYIGKAQTKPFALSEITYVGSWTKTAGTKTNATGVGFLVGLGFAAFINDVVAVEGVTGYNYTDLNNAAGTSGFVMRIGFQLYFNKKSYNDLKNNVIGE